MLSKRLSAIVGLVLFQVALGMQVAGAKPDPRLVPLILPTSQIIAGMSAPQSGYHPSSCLLMTRDNSDDLNDFLALIGVDTSRQIHQVIFTAGIGDSGALTEHSLLASGTFDQKHVFEAAIRNGAKTTEHNGLLVLLLNRSDRDRSRGNEPRWLAFPASSIAILGSVSSVQQELDRLSRGMRADDSVLKRLNDLSSDVDAWCVVVSLTGSAEIRQALDAIDADLTHLLRDGDGFQFGVRYAQKVRFDYQISSGAENSAPKIWQVLDRSLLGTGTGSSASFMQSGDAEGGTRRTIKISRERYEAWIQEVSRRSAGMRPRR